MCTFVSKKKYIFEEQISTERDIISIVCFTPFKMNICSKSILELTTKIVLSNKCTVIIIHESHMITFVKGSKTHNE